MRAKSTNLPRRCWPLQPPFCSHSPGTPWPSAARQGPRQAPPLLPITTCIMYKYTRENQHHFFHHTRNKTKQNKSDTPLQYSTIIQQRGWTRGYFSCGLTDYIYTEYIVLDHWMSIPTQKEKCRDGAIIGFLARRRYSGGAGGYGTHPYNVATEQIQVLTNQKGRVQWARHGYEVGRIWCSAGRRAQFHIRSYHRPTFIYIKTKMSGYWRNFTKIALTDAMTNFVSYGEYFLVKKNKPGCWCDTNIIWH